LSNYFSEPKREWLDAQCPKCGYKFKYVPTERWKGRIRCPECGEIFEVKEPEEEKEKPKTSLDDFVEQ